MANEGPHACRTCASGLDESGECPTCRRMDLVETAPPWFGAFGYVFDGRAAAP